MSEYLFTRVDAKTVWRRAIRTKAIIVNRSATVNYIESDAYNTWNIYDHELRLRYTPTRAASNSSERTIWALNKGSVKIRSQVIQFAKYAGVSVMFLRKIPIAVQFEAACAAVSVHERRKVWNILRWYGYPFWILRHEKHLKKYLSFTLSQLLEYFKRHPGLCKKIIVDCGDKRYSPSTYIEGEGRRFAVGYFDKNSPPNRSEVRFL